MSITPITANISSLAGLVNTSSDPSKRLDRLVNHLVKKNDTDGDGSLSSGEIAGLSADDFKTLDADGDGKLNASEIKSAVQKHFEAIKQNAQSGGVQGLQQALQQNQDTPESKLLTALDPSFGPHRPGTGRQLDRFVNRALKRNDHDGDDALSSQELSTLSSDAFKALDTDGDGKLSKDEIKTALQKQIDAIRAQFQANGAQGVTDSSQQNQDSPEGQLLAALDPRFYNRYGQAAPQQAANNSTLVDVIA